VAVAVSSFTVAEKLPFVRALPATHIPLLLSLTGITFPTPGAEVAVSVAPLVFSGNRFITPASL
jgi:hypothetical protein